MVDHPEDSQALFLAGNRDLFDGIVRQIGSEVVDFENRRFPDGETYVRLRSDVQDRQVLLFCSLDRPDPKFLPLVYTARLLREQGADSVTLVAPYLSYMRQDKQFQPGEAVTSQYFSDLLEDYLDGLITVDPHLHRYSSLDEVYELPSRVLHSAGPIGQWVADAVSDPVLVGPDAESEQWVSTIAEDRDLPYTVLTKERHGDRDVTMTLPEAFDPEGRRPVLVDDIVSTAGTMIRATEMLIERGLPEPTCVCVHPIFADDAYAELRRAGADRIVSCNTIDHESNTIDLASILSEGLTREEG